MSKVEYETLIHHRDIAGTNVSGWPGRAVKDAEQTVLNPEFPCIFARNAMKKQLGYFIFVSGLMPENMRRLGGAVERYVKISQEWTGHLDTAYPLLIAVAPSATPASSIEGYHGYGWKILQALHDIDTAPWPSEVSHDPNSAEWSMCFSGMALFVNMSCPEHVARRSRNLGSSLFLVINPRDRFDVFAGQNPSGRNTRRRIRTRIHSYDDLAHSPYLAEYGTNSLEWRQYGLYEHNNSISQKCPFEPALQLQTEIKDRLSTGGKS
ncbi:YqcI/YcgG family protein [Mycobacterium sp. BMJ-28]